MKNKNCTYIFGDGETCEKPCFGRNAYCVGHYDEVVMQDDSVPVEEDEEYALSSIPPTVATIEQVRDVMGVMIPQLIWGNVDPKVMTALTSACLAQARIIELVDIEQKLRDLEKLADTDIRYSFILDEG